MSPLRQLFPVAIALTCAAFLTACGGNDRAGETHPLERVAATPLLMEAWETQKVLLGGPAPAAPREEELRLYIRLRNAFDDPRERQTGADGFMKVWASDPTNPFWVDFSLMKWWFVKRQPLAFELLSTAAGPDTTALEHHFAYARQAWKSRKNQDNTDLFMRTISVADEGSLTWVLASMRAARTEQAAGDIEGAVARLVNVLPAAWQLGGATFASEVWFDLQHVSRSSERLDDALLAGHAMRVCARAARSGWLQARSKLEIGTTHMDRLEFGAALDTFVACRRVAVDSSCYRWARTAAGMAARAAAVRGDIAAEREHLLRMHESTVAAADSSLIVTSRIALGDVSRRLGSTDEAADWFRQAYAAEAARPRKSLRSRIDMARASLASQLGRFAAAESLRTEGARGLPGNQALEAYVNLMRLGLDTGRSDLAYRALAEARRFDTSGIKRSAEYDPVLQLEAAAARFHAQLGEYALADAALARARDRDTEASASTAWYLAEAEGLVATDAADTEAALTAFTRCVDLARDLGNSDLRRRSRIYLGATLMARGEVDAAAELFVEDLDAPEYWPRLNARLLTGMCRARAGAVEEALRIFDEVESMLGSGAAQRFLARLRLEQARALHGLGRDAAAYESLVAARRARLATADEEETDLGRSFDAHIEREIAEEALSLLHARPGILDGDPLAAGRDFAAWGSGRVRAAVSSDTSRIEFFVGDREAFSWVLPGGGASVRWQSLGSAADLAELVEALQVDMAYPGRSVDRKTLTAASDLLLGPVLADWRAGTVLEILPDGFLAGLPWAALDPSAGEGGAVIEHGPLVIVTGSPPRAEPAVRGSALLALGANEDTEAGSARRLMRAEAEAAAVAALWPRETDLRLGADARWPDLRQGGAAGYRAIHIATHTRVYEGLEGRSTIHVAGLEDAVPLTLPEIPSLGADAELIYLSSCEGARRHRSAGHGVTSFADAFIAGGAGAVVASSVLVDDEAATVLAQAFYRHWLAGKERAAALRAALLEVRDADPRWEHPFYWAFTSLYEPGG